MIKSQYFRVLGRKSQSRPWKYCSKGTQCSWNHEVEAYECCEYNILWYDKNITSRVKKIFFQGSSYQCAERKSKEMNSYVILSTIIRVLDRTGNPSKIEISGWILF